MKRDFIGLLAAFAFVGLWCVVSTLGTGCASEGLPPGAYEFVTNIVIRVHSHAAGDPAAPAAESNPPAHQETATAAGSAEAPTLVYKWGGFKGEKAVEDSNVQIGSVKMSRSGMSYKWVKGNLSAWGLSHTDASALACAFYWDGSRWVGGKFDWISTSRTTRDFKNIDSHYNGWNPTAFWAAPKRAFCIVSKDGKKRTNLEEAK